jgi:GT2 family glycosyltransferase
MKISIVIPNWNSLTLMKKHLRHVLDAVPGVEIIVVDDKSTDGSVKYLRVNFPSVRVVKRERRGGFASNVNTGVANSTGEVVILLNTDVEPERDFLKPLIAHFNDPKVFAVGCLEKSEEPNGMILRGRGLAYWRKGYYIHSRGNVDNHDTAWVSGGSGAFRKSMWERLGGMDELFNPFYWEDLDISYRARKAGWVVLFEPKSIVRHYHEQGTIKHEYTTRDINKIAYRNQFIFIWKNVTDTGILLSHIIWTPIRVLQSIYKGDLSMTIGYIQALLKIPVILKHRSIQRILYVKNDKDL